jgi:hypothetical protein
MFGFERSGSFLSVVTKSIAEGYAYCSSSGIDKISGTEHTWVINSFHRAGVRRHSYRFAGGAKQFSPRSSTSLQKVISNFQNAGLIYGRRTINDKKCTAFLTFSSWFWQDLERYQQQYPHDLWSLALTRIESQKLLTIYHKTRNRTTNNAKQTHRL